MIGNAFNKPLQAFNKPLQCYGAKGKTLFLLVENVALYDTMGLQKNLWGSRVIVDLRFIKL